MISILETCFLYIFLFIEYMVLYPHTEYLLGNIACVILILGIVVIISIHQSLWVIHPRLENKKLANCILIMSLLSMVSMYMVDVVWKFINNAMYVIACIITLMFIHLLLIGIQNHHLKKNNLHWKQEFLLLQTKTLNIEKIKYEDYLKRHLKFTFYFSLVYLFNEQYWLSLVFIIINCVYGIYLYTRAWNSGYMEGVVNASEKIHFIIASVFTSIVMLLFARFIPNVVGIMIVTSPNLLLRLYIQRYTSTFLN